MKEKFNVDNPFPIIAYLSMEVVNLYGMVRSGASDTNSVATPKNWKEGEEVIAPPPHTVDDANG